MEEAASETIGQPSSVELTWTGIEPSGFQNRFVLAMQRIETEIFGMESKQLKSHPPFGFTVGFYKN